MITLNRETAAKMTFLIIWKIQRRQRIRSGQCTNGNYVANRKLKRCGIYSFGLWLQIRKKWRNIFWLKQTALLVIIAFSPNFTHLQHFILQHFIYLLTLVLRRSRSICTIFLLMVLTENLIRLYLQSIINNNGAWRQTKYK